MGRSAPAATGRLCLMSLGDLDSFCQWLLPLPALGPEGHLWGQVKQHPSKGQWEVCSPHPPAPVRCPICPAPLPTSRSMWMCWPQPAEQHGTGQSAEDQGCPPPGSPLAGTTFKDPCQKPVEHRGPHALCPKASPLPSGQSPDAGLAPTQDTQNAVGGHWEARGILPAAHMDTSSRGQACPTLGTHTSSLCQGPVLCHHPPSHTWAGDLQSGHSSLSAHCWKRTFVNLHHED